MQETSEEATRESGELLGKVARELSALVRRDVEVAATERLSSLRRGLLDLAALSAVAIAGLFALAALSAAGGWLIAGLLSPWAAALVIAAGWALIALLAAALLLRPRAREEKELFGLLQMLAHDDSLEELRSSREDARDEAEHEMRQTSSALVTSVLDEAAEHQLKALPEVAKREVGKAEAEAVEAINDLVATLTRPARVGWRALGRLVEPSPTGTAPAPPTSDKEHEGRS